jgi:anti-sigma regulatory factor (Ser/Thr protein kinase)
VSESSQVAEARRQCVTLSQGVGFDEAAAARVALVITELATNLVKHAGRGEILASVNERDGVIAVEVLAVDKGPGMADVRQCLQDGYSTAGSAGTGLGAVMRQTQAFEVISHLGVGTAIFARVDPTRGSSSRASARPLWSTVCLPKTGELANGDAWCTRGASLARTYFIADGLGHGIEAAQASIAAVRAVEQAGTQTLPQILQSVHEALRPTRGAAVALARIDTERNRLLFAGIGNIAATIITGDATRRTVSLNGTAGHQIRRIQEFEYPFAPTSTLVMHSDGLATSWSVERYPDLIHRHPALIAGVLYRDFARGRDDVTVLVAKRD